MSLRLDAVAVHYGQRAALRTTSLEWPAGRLVALIGPNGAGKSSLLKAVAGVVPADGTIDWRGRPLSAMDARARAATLAYLPQAPAAHWPIGARELVALGRLPHRGFGRRPGSGDEAAVERAMRLTDVAEFAARPVTELSGGERARVLLARALAVEAPVLLVDEPVASLDPYHQLQIMAVLAAYAEQGALVVAALHDLTLAARFCDRAVLMHEGRLVADGAPGEVLSEQALRDYYRIRPYDARHDDQALIVPWARVDAPPDRS